jgi:hypothetical protein
MCTQGTTVAACQIARGGKRGGPAYCLTSYAEPMRASFSVTLHFKPLNILLRFMCVFNRGGFRSALLMATSLQIAKLVPFAPLRFVYCALGLCSPFLDFSICGGMSCIRLPLSSGSTVLCSAASTHGAGVGFGARMMLVSEAFCQLLGVRLWGTIESPEHLN